MSHKMETKESDFLSYTFNGVVSSVSSTTRDRSWSRADKKNDPKNLRKESELLSFASWEKILMHHQSRDVRQKLVQPKNSCNFQLMVWCDERQLVQEFLICSQSVTHCQSLGERRRWKRINLQHHVHTPSLTFSLDFFYVCSVSMLNC